MRERRTDILQLESGKCKFISIMVDLMENFFVCTILLYNKVKTKELLELLYEHFNNCKWSVLLTLIDSLQNIKTLN